MVVPVRVLIQVGGNEPNEVGWFPATDPQVANAETAQGLRELADVIERGES